MFSIINFIKRRKKEKKILKKDIKKDLFFLFQEKKEKYSLVLQNFSFLPILTGILGVFMYQYLKFKYFTYFYFFVMTLLIFYLEEKKVKNKNLFFTVFLEILAVYCFFQIVFLIFREIWELIK